MGRQKGKGKREGKFLALESLPSPLFIRTTQEKTLEGWIASIIGDKTMTSPILHGACIKFADYIT